MFHPRKKLHCRLYCFRLWAKHEVKRKPGGGNAKKETWGLRLTWLDLITWPMRNVSCCSCALMSTGQGWGLASLSVQPLHLSVTHTHTHTLVHILTRTYAYIQTHTRSHITHVRTHTHVRTQCSGHTPYTHMLTHTYSSYPGCISCLCEHYRNK